MKTLTYFSLAAAAAGAKWDPLAKQRERYGLKDNEAHNIGMEYLKGRLFVENSDRIKKVKSSQLRPPTKSDILAYTMAAIQQNFVQEISNVGKFSEPEPSQYGRTCGVIGEKVDFLRETQRERNRRTKANKGKNKGRKKRAIENLDIPYNNANTLESMNPKIRARRNTSDGVPSSDGFRIFGGTKANINEIPWQAYFHISQFIDGNSDEGKEWQAILHESDYKSEDDMDFLNSLVEMVEECNAKKANGEECVDVDDELENLVAEMKAEYEAENSKDIYADTISKPYLCGSVIISSAYTLTAAHCSMLATDLARSGIVVGLTEIDIKDGAIMIPAENWRPIREVIQHPGWNIDKLINDIALLKMKYTFEFNRETAPICMPTRNLCLKEGHRLKISGWGETEDFEALEMWDEANDIEMVDGEFIEKEHLRSAMVPIEKNNDCSYIYSDRKYLGEDEFSEEVLIDRSHICAGGEKGVDACGGDSGGPATVVDKNGVTTLVGLVSWGDFCGKENYPTVYTRVSAFMDWINENSNVWNQIQDLTAVKGEKEWFDDPFEFGSCMDTQYAGAREFMTGIENFRSFQTADEPQTNQVQNKDNHITADFADFNDVDDYYEQTQDDFLGTTYGQDKYYCATKGNKRLNYASGQMLTLDDCRQTDLSSEWAMNPVEKEIRGQGLNDKEIQWCWSSKAYYTKNAYGENTQSMRRQIEIEECGQANMQWWEMSQDIGYNFVTERKFRYDVHSNRIIIERVQEKVNFASKPMVVAYNMWKPERLTQRWPQYIHWGSRSFANSKNEREVNLIDEHGNLMLLPKSTFHLGQKKDGARFKKDGFIPARYCATITTEEQTQTFVFGKGRKRKTVKKKVQVKAVGVINCQDLTSENKVRWGLKTEEHFGKTYTSLRGMIFERKPKRVVKGKGKRRKYVNVKKKGKQVFEDSLSNYCLGFNINQKGYLEAGKIKLIPCGQLKSPVSKKGQKLVGANREWFMTRVVFDKQRQIIASGYRETSVNGAKIPSKYCMFPRLNWVKKEQDISWSFESLTGERCMYGYSWNRDDTHHKNAAIEFKKMYQYAMLPDAFYK